MAVEQPFEIRGVKIPVGNLPGEYADLLGGTLDTSVFTPWNQVIKEIKADGANNVTLIISTGVMRNATDSQFDPSINYNPDLAAIRSLAALIQANGMSVSLSTFTHVAGAISGDPSKVGSDRPYPVDQRAWLSNFSTLEVGWARFAKEIGATAFLPFGDEIQHLLRDTSLTPGWLSLIGQIRQEFSGALSTNLWTPGYGDSITAIPAEIISKLDYLGVGFFPNLTLDANASIQALSDAYHNDMSGNDVLGFLQGLASTYGKEIWIGDKAFHSFDGAAANEARIFDASIPLTQDLQEQALLYDSFLKVMTSEGGNWLAGVSFQSFNNVNDQSTMLPRFMNGPLSESPQGKPAEQVLLDWFNGLRQGPGLSLTDSFRSSTLVGGYNNDTMTGGLGNDTLIGNSGNDVLTGGPSTYTGVDVYTVDVLVRGVPSQGTAPIVKVIDSSAAAVVTQSVTGSYEVGKISQSGEATHISFDLVALTSFSVAEANWAIFDTSDTGNRFVHIESVQVNGVSLDLSKYATYVPPSPYTTGVGQLDSVHGGKFVFDISQTATPPKLVVPSDNDALTGGSGNDTIDGGTGTDTAMYAGNRSSFVLATTSGGWISTDTKGTEGMDTLQNVERLKFSDGAIALDVGATQSGGETALLMGAVLPGRLAFDASKQALLGTAIDLFDQGYSLQTLSGAVMRLPIWDILTGKATPSSTDIATYLLTNVNGVAPDATTLASALAALNTETSFATQGNFLWHLVESSANQTHVGLVGLASTGLAYGS